MIRFATCAGAASAAALALLAAAAQAGAQSLAARVDAAPAGAVQFHFAARPGVCGNGRSFIQTSPGNVTGSFRHTSRNARCTACR